ncbi:hypothetical protein SLEP1_g19464 [Rubroshorea leprosula]|uniref:Reverse transcriptase domain-containing protein n=1 Tax=Rubroshorea leprosula TaxID=152421 RepID=A0AAV5J728_9ROSI|nr:hypothetical protein SLEP1_g19464 [Rubroshorea leprosula]
MAIFSVIHGASRKYPPRGWRFSKYSYPYGGDGGSDNNGNFFNLFEELEENDNEDDESEHLVWYLIRTEVNSDKALETKTQFLGQFKFECFLQNIMDLLTRCYLFGLYECRNFEWKPCELRDRVQSLVVKGCQTLMGKQSDEPLKVRTLEENASSVVCISNSKGSGSGFVWDDLGHIVTNYHVIDGASDHKVTFDDNSTCKAVFVGFDEDKDIAVLLEVSELIVSNWSSDGVNIPSPQMRRAAISPLFGRVYDGGEVQNFDHLTEALKHSFTDSFLHIYLDLDDSMNLDSIGEIPIEIEILKVVKSMKPFKAPSLDGTHPFFYQGYWPSVKDKVCRDVKDIFCTGVSLNKWNECLLALIPKVKSPEIIQQFKPIGLCNTSYKIVSKILVNRLKLWMDKLMSPCQSNFIFGRQGMDNVIILQELVYSFAKKPCKSWDMICKLDLQKAYDILEWSFIKEALSFFQFPMKIIDLIMSIVSFLSISILVNIDKTESFLPSRGIH